MSPRPFSYRENNQIIMAALRSGAVQIHQKNHCTEPLVERPFSAISFASFPLFGPIPSRGRAEPMAPNVFTGRLAHRSGSAFTKEKLMNAKTRLPPETFLMQTKQAKLAPSFHAVPFSCGKQHQSGRPKLSRDLFHAGKTSKRIASFNARPFSCGD